MKEALSIVCNYVYRRGAGTSLRTPFGSRFFHHEPFGVHLAMFSGFGGLGDDSDGPRFGNYAEKSAAAERREKAATNAFDKMLAGAGTNPATPMAKFELLPPHVHLTGPCWRDFKKHVGRFPGWSVSRRVATEEEKSKSGETRKGAVHFVECAYKPPKPGKAAKPPTAAPKSTSSITTTPAPTVMPAEEAGFTKAQRSGAEKKEKKPAAGSATSSQPAAKKTKSNGGKGAALPGSQSF